jgi:hypothetical protein
LMEKAGNSDGEKEKERKEGRERERAGSSGRTRITR